MLWVMIMIGAIFVIFSSASVSAMEWDNVHSYNPETREVVITNALGLGDDLMKIKLLENTEHCSVDCYAILQVENYDDTLILPNDYDGIFNWEFENLLNSKYENINHNFEIAYTKSNITKKIGEDCSTDGTNQTTCQEVYETNEVYNWQTLDYKNFKVPSTFYLKLNGQKDYKEIIDWKPTLIGVKIDEWAKWGVVNAVANFTFDTATLGDDTGLSYGDINTPALWSQKTAGCIDGNCITTENGIANNSYNTQTTVGGWSFWIKPTINTSLAGLDNNCFLLHDAGGNNKGDFAIGMIGNVTGYDCDGVGLAGSVNKGKMLFYFNNVTGVQAISTTSTFTAGQWYHLFFKLNASKIGIYVNGTKEAEGYGSSNQAMYGGGGVSWTVHYYGGYVYGNYTLDEVKFYNTEITDAQILDMYQTEGGIGETPLSTIVTLISPADSYNSTQTNQYYSANFTATNGNMTNATLQIWNNSNSLVYTNFTTITGTFNTTNLSISSIADGTYKWNYLGCAVNSTSTLCAYNTNRTFIVDTTAPTLNIIHPSNNSLTINGNLSLNYSGADAGVGMGACWYNLDGGDNVTIASCTNSTFNTTNAKHIINLFVNDTLGNSNSTSSTFWAYNYSTTYTSPVIEGETSTLYFNVQTTNLTSYGTNLTHNNTLYPMTFIENNGTDYRFNKTLTSPLVSANTNIPFNFSYYLNGNEYGSNDYNQTISNFGIDNCSTNSIKLYTFTIKDETEQFVLNQTTNNTLGKVDLQVHNYANQLLNQFNKSYSQINPFSICINSSLPNGERFLVDAIVQYKGGEYQLEYYNIQNETINNLTLAQNISLYSLHNTSAQIFKLIVKDGSFLAIKNALVEVHRRYIEEGTYKIVEIPKTDGLGESIANLVLNDVVYKFIIKRYNTTLATFDNVLAVCQTPLVSPCTIDFNAFATGIDTPDYEEGEDFNFTLGFNKTSRVVSSQYVIPSGSSSEVTLVVEVQDALGTQACNDTETSASGTLSCTVPNTFGNMTAFAKIYRDDELQAQGSINMQESPSEIYGTILIVLGLFVMLTLMGAAMSDNPVFTIVFFVVGVIILFALNLVANNGFIGATATILWLIVAVVIVIIKGAQRS